MKSIVSTPMRLARERGGQARMRKAQPFAAAEHDHFGRRVDQHREVLGAQGSKEETGQAMTGASRQHENAARMAHQIDFDVVGAVAGDGVQGAAGFLM